LRASKWVEGSNSKDVIKIGSREIKIAPTWLIVEEREGCHGDQVPQWSVKAQ